MKVKLEATLFEMPIKINLPSSLFISNFKLLLVLVPSFLFISDFKLLLVLVQAGILGDESSSSLFPLHFRQITLFYPKDKKQRAPVTF